MPRLRVKICGITTPEDAALVGRLGADAIGLVFWSDSPRAVDLSAAREILAATDPFVTRVGVFVDQPPDAVREVALAVGLDVIQLHGSESADDCRAIGLRTIKAFRVGPGFDAGSVRSFPADGYLLDTRVHGMPGGTGQVFDWSLAAGVPRDKLILAGGVSAANVAQGVAALRPVGVDLSSSVESAPGKKDPALLEQFFEVVRQLPWEDRS